VWIARAVELWRRAIWLNPVPEEQWGWTPSIGIVRELMGERMYPLTLEGLTRAIERLRH
jgi:hypothetical protein